MSARERTVQRLDPIGTLGAMPLVILIGAVIVVYSIYSTVQQSDQILRPSAAGAAEALIIATAAFFVYSARPARAPLGAGAHAVIVVAALTASSLFTASTWWDNRLLQDDWGQVTVALLLLGLALFRPAWEIVVSAAASAVVLGATAMAEFPFLEVRNSPWVYALVVAAPVVILACAGAAYAQVMIAALVSWQQQLRESARRLEPEVRATAARILQQEQATLLNREAVPFLTELLRRGELTPADSERARQIADTLRGHARAEADGGWIRQVLGDGDRVRDPRALSEAMDDGQRAALTAYLDALRGLPGGLERRVTIDFAESSGRALCAVGAQAPSRPRLLRRQLIPYLAVFRQVADGAVLRARGDRILLRFEYVAE